MPPPSSYRPLNSNIGGIYRSASLNNLSLSRQLKTNVRFQNHIFDDSAKCVNIFSCKSIFAFILKIFSIFIANFPFTICFPGSRSFTLRRCRRNIHPFPQFLISETNLLSNESKLFFGKIFLFFLKVRNHNFYL